MRSPRRRRSLLVEPLEHRRLLAVTRLSLDDFANPDVLDFSSAAVGSVSETDGLFTEFGISRISASGSNSADTFDARPNASRALWADDNGLRIVDPGTVGLRRDGLTYTIEFANDQTRFGIGVHDEPGVYVLQLFANDTDLGSFAFSSGGDLTQKYIESSMAFDKIVVHYTSRIIDQGFALDNITLEREAGQHPNASDDDVEVNEDSGPIVFDVTTNDSDPDGDINLASTTVETGPSHGELVELGNAIFSYTPAPNFHGTDTFTYIICDAQGLCDQAEVTITVNSVIDAVIDVEPGKESKPLNLRSNRRVSVAILSTQTSTGELEDFDATQVDTSTVKINGQSLAAVDAVIEDIDDDGDLDLVLRFLAREIAEGAVTDVSEVDLFLTAESFDGDPLAGSDTVRFGPPGRGWDRNGSAKLRTFDSRHIWLDPAKALKRAERWPLWKAICATTPWAET